MWENREDTGRVVEGGRLEGIGKKVRVVKEGSGELLGGGEGVGGED